MAVTEANRSALRGCRDPRFPHMAPGDCAVWSAALARGLLPDVEWSYDVRLGSAACQTDSGDGELEKMWAALKCKRLDAVGESPDCVYLVEVKPVASFSALGQALGYCWLWRREVVNALRPVPLVVCGFCDDDLRDAFPAFGVRVIELPPGDAELILARLEASRPRRARL